MNKEEAIKLIDDRMCFGRGKWSEHHRPVIDEYWQAGEMAIKALEAEPHWIPCGKCIHADGKHRRCKILGRSINEDYFCYWAEPFKGVTE